MTATKTEIADWFAAGAKNGYTHMIVWCDTYDWEDYPEYFTGTPLKVRQHVAEKDGKNMQKLMEVYNLKTDLAPQLAQHRAFNYGG